MLASMTNWAELRACYGSAEELPELLEALDPDPGAPVWGKLWGHVYHQGTTYEASPFVLPALANAAASWNAPGRPMPLSLAGAIVAAPDTVLTGFEASVKDLRELALDTVTAPELTANDRVYVMQALLAFEGDPIWGRELESLNDGEINGRCSSCDRELTIAIPGNIEPRPRDELPEPGARLITYAIRAGDVGLANRLCELFGWTECLECGARVDIAECVGRSLSPQ